MLNTIKIDGQVRDRKSKAMFTNDYSEIGIQCFDCGDWVEIKKLTNDHITKKFHCGSCSRKIKSAIKKAKKKPVKKVVKKSTRVKPQWAENCEHMAFFKCKSPRECQGCYYNPTKKIALQSRYGIPFEPGEKKNAKDHWFYGNKKHVTEALKLLADIKSGKGLKAGGNRSYFRYARKEDEE